MKIKVWQVSYGNGFHQAYRFKIPTEAFSDVRCLNVSINEIKKLYLTQQQLNDFEETNGFILNK